MTGLFIAAVLVAVVVLFVKQKSASDELENLRDDVVFLKRDVSALREYINQLWRFLEDERRAAAKAAADAAETQARAPDAPRGVVADILTPAVEVTPLTEAPAPSPLGETPLVAAVEVVPTAEPASEAALGTPDTTADVEPQSSAPELPQDVEPLAAKEQTGETQRPPVAPLSPPTPPRGLFGLDWEDLVGIRLFSAIAGIAVVLAALFFLRYSVDRGWLGPPVRAAIGLAVGIGLLVVCELRVARGYRFTANAMHGAGIATLYGTLFAIHGIWHLAPAAVVFALMLLVTAVAVALSIRRDSVFIATLGLLGGFATPALLSTGENRPIALFSYLLLLNAGLSWVAFKKRWVSLTVFSLILTVTYQWAWVARFMSAAQLPVAVGIFAIFGIAGAASLWLPRSGASGDRRFDRVAIVAAVLPFSFGLFAAAVPAYGARYHTLFGFLLLAAAGLSLIALRRNLQWMHGLAGAASVVAFAIWCVASYAPSSWPALLAWHLAFVILFATVAARREWIGNYAAPALFFVFALLPALDRQSSSAALFFGALLLELAIVAGVAVWWRRGLLYFGAAGFAIVAEGVWAAKFLDAAHLLAALVAFGSFGIVMLAVPAIARRVGRELEPRIGPTATAIASLLLLAFLTRSSIAAASLWGLAVILGLLLVGTIRESRVSGHPIAGAIAIALGWMILALWWGSAPLAASLVPALIVVSAVALVALLTSSLRLGGSVESPSAAAGSYLALAAHLFLLFVAYEPSLSIPPWPLFAVLVLVDLGAAIVALVQRRPALLGGASVGTLVVLFAWCSHLGATRWPAVALAATTVMAAWAVAWYPVGKRFGGGFEWPALTTLLLGHAVAIAAGARGGEDLLPLLLLVHLALALATAVMAWLTGWHEGILLSAVATALAVTLAPLDSAGFVWQFGFATALYTIFIAYPLALGGRAGKSTLPHAAAVLASAPYFFIVRAAMLDAGYGWMIGVLPVAQALALLAILVRVLRSGTAETRGLTRMALLAAAALAFITVAVPLQLDRQWITVAWALEGAALVWLYRRIPHRGLLAWGGVLLGICFVRLAMNSEVLRYYPSEYLVFNWYLYTYAVTAAAFFATVWLLPSDMRRWRAAAATCGTILLFVLLNIEIADFFAPRGAARIEFVTASRAQSLTYTIGWALFALSLLVAGIAAGKRAARIAALALLVITILKCFFVDLANLGGLYRVGSLIGLAMCLVAVGVLIQKFVVSRSARVEVTA